MPHRSLGIRIRRVKEGLVLGFRDEALLLSDSAEFIYRSADGHRSVADIAAEVAAEYGIDHSEALDDVTELLVDLAANGIFEW
ncbi:PqqD family protein [Streptomyces goshikiensis]|uniref:PqqD family protein n=1 Tax=Streptomyces goshikiensis TaxID=1942 RepID=UPI0037F38B14